MWINKKSLLCWTELLEIKLFWLEVELLDHLTSCKQITDV